MADTGAGWAVAWLVCGQSLSGPRGPGDVVPPSLSMTKTFRFLRYATVLLAVTALVTGCGGSSTTSPGGAGHRPGRQSARRATSAAPATFAFHHLYSLPAPLRDPAAAALGGSRFVLAGGLSAADTSTGEIDIADLHHIVRTGSLPGVQHDAQAAGLPDGTFVFGGANFTQYDHIYRIDSRASAATVGTLPTLASDVAVTESGATAYIVGGYDGSAALNTVVAWAAGRGARVVGHLPVALRYAAVTATASGQILVIGGTTAAGSASRAVYSFAPATGRTREIAKLRHPITHAGAVTIGAFSYLVGGRGSPDNAQTDSLWSIDPLTGRVRPAGHLPAPTSDAGVLRIGNAIIVAGGLTPTGTTLAEVGALVPAR